IVNLLIKNGADVNAEGGFHGNALQAVLDIGHQSVVHLLLEHGAKQPQWPRRERRASFPEYLAYSSDTSTLRIRKSPYI
ncbi:hypothetical protein C8J57DRAFT_1294523, partial [Mycena rebaudengoi]